MAAPTIRGFTNSVLSDTGTVTSPAGTQVGDLVLCFVWSQGTNAPTAPAHSVQAGFTEVRSHSHNDGTTDGRLSIAGKVATVAGANSYQAYSISGATAGQTCAAIVVITTGTYETNWPIGSWFQGTVTGTGTTAPDPPAINALNGDFLSLAIGAWHVTTAAATTTTAPTSWTEQVDGPTGTHVTHLAVASRSYTAQTNVAVNPGVFVDNVTPNGTVGGHLIIPGVDPPVTFVAANYNTGALPTGSLPGDLILITAYDLSAPGPYTGWTAVAAGVGPEASGYYCGSFYRVWQAGDSMPTLPSANHVASYRYAHQTNPLVAASLTMDAGADTTIPVGDLTNEAVDLLNCAVYQSGGNDGTTETPPTNYTERTDSGLDGTSGDRVKLGTGITTGGDVTCTAASPHFEMHVIIRQLNVTVSATRRGRVSWAEFEVPNVPHRAQVSFAELEVPNVPHRAQVSWAELEVPNAPRRAQISFAELEIPLPPRRAQVSWAEFEVPTLVQTRRALVSWAEFEVPLPPRRAMVSWAELEVPDMSARRARVSWAEMEVPPVPARAQVSFAEMEFPTPGAPEQSQYHRLAKRWR